eukprot:CAMPEP_0174260632 /NCGR_PEP_ID=MMETSP0439-20130205/10135_1 /TAXON_ID=0 /ORGANISM="Stereomyxa ramosa, Strain Chinc5" /LENGTH=327 /DNA_ID=CAMNT_0015344917 /DNA_START=50 /DNA_END=1030 /DNA_ORIENTATION=+
MLLLWFLLGFLIVFVLAWAVDWYTYNYKLSTIPGPTHWVPLVGMVSLIGDKNGRQIMFRECYEKYGPIFKFRLFFPWVVMCDAEDQEILYENHHVKSLAYTAFNTYFQNSRTPLVDLKKAKKAISKSSLSKRYLSEVIFDQLDAISDAMVSELKELWEKGEAKGFKIEQVIEHYIMHVNLTWMLGTCFDIQDCVGMCKNLESLTEHVSEMMSNPIHLLTRRSKDDKELEDKLRLLMKRSKEQELDCLSRYEPVVGYDEAVQVRFYKTTLAAGVKPLSSSITWGVYEAIKSPKCCKKVQEEFDALMDSQNGKLSYDAISRLPELKNFW